MAYARSEADACSRWLVPLRREDDFEVRLVCFPHAGGGAWTFRPWCEALRPRIAVHGIQLPGREDRMRESPLRVLEDVLEPVTAALSPLDERPLVLFGHSMGAILAFEVAKRLFRSDGVRPSALMVSGRVAPHIAGRAPRLGHLPAPELVRRIAEQYRGIPAAILGDAEMANLMGRVLQADLAIVECYENVADEPLECPIVALGGDEDAWVARNELEAWGRHTRRAFSWAQIPGDHFYYKTEESLRSLLTHVREACLGVSPRADDSTERL
jgi:surfactin synthase thioesterase subunit